MAADRVTKTVADGWLGAEQWLNLTANTPYTFSAFIKPEYSSQVLQLGLYDNVANNDLLGVYYNTGSNFLDRYDGSSRVIAHGMSRYKNGWYRLWVSFQPISTGSHTLLLRPDAWSGLYSALFWGAQLEQGTFPTSYIPTTTSTVSRAADIANLFDLSFMNPSQGSFIVDFFQPFMHLDSDVKTLLSADSGAATDRHYVYVGPADGMAVQMTKTAGTTGGPLETSGYSGALKGVMGYTYQTNDLKTLSQWRALWQRHQCDSADGAHQFALGPPA